MKKKIAGWFLFDDCGECLPLHSKFCKRWNENIPGEQGNSLAQQDDRQGRILEGEKKWNSTNSAPLLPADSSSFPSQEERKPRWKEEISGKEMKRALLARFFSCLTQLSDFAFKFKTADQTTRGTLYSCQEPRWDLSGTLLHARNKKLCLSPSFFCLHMVQRAKKSPIHGWVKARIYGILSAGLGGGSRRKRKI